MTFEQMQIAGDQLTQLDVAKYSREIALEYRRAYTAIKADLTKFYAKLAGLPPEEWTRYVYQRDRLKGLLANVTAEYNKSALKAGKIQIGVSKTSIANNYYRQQFAVDYAAGLSAFTVLPASVIEVSVLGTPKVWADITKKAQEKIESTFGAVNQYQPKYGTLTQVLTDNATKDIAKIKSAVTQGIIKGDGVQAVSKNLRKVFETTASNAERIFRTENHRNRANGDWANYQAITSEGVEIWREIISVLDDRTRPQSAQVDGRIDKDGSGFLYPDGNKYIVPGSTGVPAYDINDRERVIDIIPNVDKGDRIGRDPETGKNEIMSYHNFETWAKGKGLTKNRYGQLLFT